LSTPDQQGRKKISIATPNLTCNTKSTMTPPATQPATEEEDEGTIISTGIVLKDPKKSSATALGIFVNEVISYY
jgi:hypothetical protein